VRAVNRKGSRGHLVLCLDAHSSSLACGNRRNRGTRTEKVLGLCGMRTMK